MTQELTAALPRTDTSVDLHEPAILTSTADARRELCIVSILRRKIHHTLNLTLTFRNFCESRVGMKNRGWIDILSNNDDEALWTNLYGVISRHAAVRMICGPHSLSIDGLKDVYSDLT